MRKMLGILVLLICTGFVSATDFTVPNQKINGADKPVPVGEAIELSVPPINPKPENYQSSNYTWKVFSLPDGVEKVDKVHYYENKDGSNGVFFGGGITAKKYLVLCYAEHIYVIKKGDGTVGEWGTRTVVLQVIVTYGDGVPPPNPNPNPNPPDVPVLPDGVFKLAKFAYDEGMKFPDDKVKTAKAFSDSFKGLASKAAAGAFKDVETLLKETTKTNSEALKNAGVDNTKLSDFKATLNNKLYGLYQGGQLNTVSDYGVAFKELSDGLAQVK